MLLRLVKHEMRQLDKNDLAQMNRDYFQSLEKERLVEVATNLHKLAVEQWEKLQQNSQNSSRPPSSDNPYQKADLKEKERTDQESTEPEAKLEGQEISAQDEESSQDEVDGGQPCQDSSNKKRSPGHQPGTPSQWRSTALVASEIVPHYPSQCAACGQSLSTGAPKPYMGHYVLELEREDSGFRVVCQLHHYYEATCSCGHISQAKPGQGYVFSVEGRSRDLKLTEYVLVGPHKSDSDCQSGCPLPHFASQNSGILEGLGSHGVRDWHD